MDKSHLSQRQLFQTYLAQTSPSPLGLEIEKAEGSFLFDRKGKKYLDLISGISVSNVGHCHPEVIDAIKKQAEKFLHLMVYGEYIQSPQVLLAEKISSLLGDGVWATYLVNSGSEACDGAMKLARRFTGRSDFISFKNAYHGSTMGALSLIGDDEYRSNYMPLIPGTRRIRLNHAQDLEYITEDCAAVFWEPIQGEAGVIETTPEFAKQLRKRCNQTGTLLVSDEIQTGFGRTGKWFAWQHFDLVPDIVLMAKGMNGGMPGGAFAARTEVMRSLMDNPVLGHITTFGGHPVGAAAALACIDVIEKDNLIKNVSAIFSQFKAAFNDHSETGFRGKGLLIALTPKEKGQVPSLIQKALAKGIIVDWFLFDAESIRIAPPLNIGKQEAAFACSVLQEILEGK